jgi:hypothetical protein
MNTEQHDPYLSNIDEEQFQVKAELEKSNSLNIKL